MVYTDDVVTISCVALWAQVSSAMRSSRCGEQEKVDFNKLSFRVKGAADNEMHLINDHQQV